MKSNFLKMAILVAMMGMVSCQKEMYDEALIEANKAAAEKAKQEQVVNDYEDNFVKTYGEVDPDQSWDFSSEDVYFNIPSSRAQTRGTRDASYTMTQSESYYEVESATLSKMKSVFGEGHDNRALGKPFAMTVPGNDFTIMPIYMGQSGGDFDLYMHVDGIGEILVWRKWEGIQAKFAGSDKWQNLYKIVEHGFWPFNWTTRESTTNGKNTVDATAIQSQYITFSGLPEGANMYFYLKITTAAEGYNKNGEALGSVNNYMREYKFTTTELPSELPGVDEPEVKIIGCEDASTNRSDNDFNDVVFMIYGEPYVPSSFEVTDLEKVVKKRYMIEDLGSSDDTDFNDIVVDVVSTYSYKQTTSSDGHVTYSDEELKGRLAEIKALGGTLDVEINIGGAVWRKGTSFNPGEMINTQSPDYSKTLDSFVVPNSWNPTSNDIQVTVYKKNGSNQVSAQINFPQIGEIPMIIATDATEKWSLERNPFNFKRFMGQ
jgi:hypothetical protein